MTEDRKWRSITPEESAVVTAIVSAAGLPGGSVLLEELDGALVSHETAWILDVKTSKSTSGADFPNEPFPARAYVPSNAAYRGEVIIWVENGIFPDWNTLDYGQPPTRWPRPDEMEVVTQSVN